MERIIIDGTNIDATAFYRDRISRSLKVLSPFLESFKGELAPVKANERIDHYFDYMLYHLAILYTLVYGEISLYERKREMISIDDSIERIYEHYYIEDALKYDLSAEPQRKPLLLDGVEVRFWFAFWCHEKSENVISSLGRIAALIEDSGIPIDDSAPWLKAMKAFLAEFTPLFMFLGGPIKGKNTSYSAMDDLFKKYHINYYYESKLKKLNIEKSKIVKKFKKQYNAMKDEALYFVDEIEKVLAEPGISFEDLISVFIRKFWHDDRIMNLEFRIRELRNEGIEYILNIVKAEILCIRCVPVTRSYSEKLLKNLDPEGLLNLDKVLIEIGELR